MRWCTIVVTLLSLCLVGCAKSEAKPSAKAVQEGPQILELEPSTLERLGVEAAPVGVGGDAPVLRLPGTLEYVADKYAEVGTVVEGRVTRIHVTVGERVRKGQPLATLLVPAIVSAQAEAIAARAALDVARDHAKREAWLLERQLTTKREDELARGEATRAEAELAAASAKLALFGAPVPASGEAIRAHGSLVLASPLDGVVVARNVVAGGFLEPRDAAFAVADTTQLWAVLDAYESDVASLKENAVTEIRVDALAGRVFSGQIAMIEPQLGKSSRALRARVVVANPDGALRPGLFVRASIKLEASGSDIVLPKAAVQPIGGKDVVFVEKERGRYEVRPVVVARRTPQLVAIADGVRSGERVVVHGAFVLRGEVTKQ